jgi:large subunit ribosomal protein L9
MPTKTVQLLLTENVDNLGIVGDVVNVRVGYARNYLLPRELATTPSQEKLAALAEKRAEAERERARLLEHRREMIGRMEGLELTLLRSCNDLGHLYGSVTQQDVAEELAERGFEVKPREVRLPFTIKRVDTFDVLVKFASDLEATIKLNVEPDRTIAEDERDEMEFDNEGNLIERPARPAPPAGDEAPEAEGADEPAAETPEA